MRNITDKDLEEEVRILNNTLQKRGSSLALKYEVRNGFCTVDFTKEDRKGTFISSVSRRECYEGLITVSKFIEIM